MTVSESFATPLFLLVPVQATRPDEVTHSNASMETAFGREKRACPNWQHSASRTGLRLATQTLRRFWFQESANRPKAKFSNSGVFPITDMPIRLVYVRKLS